MNDETKFKVMLYSDESHQAFSAAVYTATLLKNMPNMHLTIVQVKESEDNFSKTPNNWLDSWTISSTSDWIGQSGKILSITNNIFKSRGTDVFHQVIYSNPSIADTVDSLLDYATKKSINLIIMGTRGLTTLKGLIFGCLAHNVLNRSPIPVLLVKKLPQDYIDQYLLDYENFS